MLYDNKFDEMDYNKIDKINERIRLEIKEWGSQDAFFEDDEIPYTKPSFHNCRRNHTLPPIGVIIKIADKLNCDVGFLLCEYDEKHYIAADVKRATGLDEDTISIIMHMKNYGQMMEMLNDLMKNDNFRAMLQRLYYAEIYQRDYIEFEKKANDFANRMSTRYENGSDKDKEDISSTHIQYLDQSKFYKGKVWEGRYAVMTAMSRFLDDKFGKLQEVEPMEIPNWEKKKEYTIW